MGGCWIQIGMWTRIVVMGHSSINSLWTIQLHIWKEWVLWDTNYTSTKWGFESHMLHSHLYHSVFHLFLPVWICPTGLVSKEHPLVVFTGYVKTLLTLKESQVKCSCVTSRQHTDSLAHFKMHLRNIRTRRTVGRGTSSGRSPPVGNFRNLPCWERAASMMEAEQDHEQYIPQARKDPLTWGLWEMAQQSKGPCHQT